MIMNGIAVLTSFKAPVCSLTVMAYLHSAGELSEITFKETSV